MSLSSVASEIGVTSMALYRVVADAEELRRLIANAAGVALQPPASGEPLLHCLHAWAIDAHEQLARYPGLASYVLREWTELPAWLAIVEHFLDQAAREGLTGANGVSAVNAVFAYVLARSQLRQGVTTRRRLQPLRDDPNAYPNIRAQRREFETARIDTAFRFGLDAICAGILQVVR